MAHITHTLQPHFTGHIGPVRFTNGHAETDDPDPVAYFADRPDEFEVRDENGDPYLADPGDLKASHQPLDPDALEALRDELNGAEHQHDDPQE